MMDGREEPGRTWYIAVRRGTVRSPFAPLFINWLTGLYDILYTTEVQGCAGERPLPVNNIETEL